MNTNMRYVWYLLVAAAAVVLIWYVANQSQSGIPMPTPTPVAGSGATPTPKPGTTPASTNGAMPKSYSDAVNLYKNGKRIQFDIYCHANPATQTFKSGTSIMLDNRSGDARVISVGSTRYSLAGYGWRIITVSSRTIPATLVIGCGSTVNVGSILVQ